MAGIHPVELIVTSAEGPELSRETVFLNRLPDPDRERAEPIPVSLVLPVESAPSLAVDGTAAFSPETAPASRRPLRCSRLRPPHP